MTPVPGELTFVAPGAASRRATSPTSPSTSAARPSPSSGSPPTAARQLSTHYFARLTDDPDAMTDLPKDVRAQLVAGLLPSLLTSVQRAARCDGGTTRKYVWKLHDGALVESVLMRYPGRVTVCVSSQAGCGMNCPFCATGQAGLTRNMSTAEIVEQVMVGARALHRGEIPGGDIAPGADRVSNVVFMGMGEPLANYNAVDRCGAPAHRSRARPGSGMSQRNITVSTVGLVPAIDKLAAEGMPVRLALSLHAPDDELRNELVPINTRWTVAEALDAARRYFDATGRRVSIEYALIRDINDQAWRADLLGEAAQPARHRLGARQPDPAQPDARLEVDRERRGRRAGVRRRGCGRKAIATTIRDTRGREIDGACGQLAATTA